LALADGFIEVPENQLYVDEGEHVLVRLFSSRLKPADLTIIGSHCVGVDILLRSLRRSIPDFQAKVINVGSMGGIHAIRRGEADIAGIHLLDEKTGEYNIPFIRRYGLSGRVALIRGYIRQQGLIVQKGNPKQIRDFKDLLRDDVTFVNRNKGSGTRILTDMMLRRIAEESGRSMEDVTALIKGYRVEVKSHSAVAAAIHYGKADVGVGIRAVAEQHNLDFIPIADEQYDFLVLRSRLDRRPIKAFIETLNSEGFRLELEREVLGLRVTKETGKIILV